MWPESPPVDSHSTVRYLFPEMKTLSPIKQARAVGVVLSMLVLLYAGCDKGLAPLAVTPIDPNAPTGFGGTIRFTNWPPLDSVDIAIQELRLAAFKEAPVDTTGLFIEFIRGNVIIYPPVGTTAWSKRDSTGHLRDSIHYDIYFTTGLDSLPKSYSYIAMAWRYGPNSFADWRPAGLYTTQPGTFIPGAITIRKNVFISNVDINCDFRNPPPKPWR